MSAVKNRLIGLSLFAMSTVAVAQGDCSFCDPLPVEQTPQTVITLCDYAAVREAQALYDEQIKPIKKLIDIAKSPQGFLLEQFSENIYPLPEWLTYLGYLSDPKGALKGLVLGKAREEAKRAVGLDKSCNAPPENVIDEAVWLES